MTFEEWIREWPKSHPRPVGHTKGPSFRECYETGASSERQPMDCTHPRACRVGAGPSISEPAYCAWCAERERHEAEVKGLVELVRVLDTLLRMLMPPSNSGAEHGSIRDRVEGVCEKYEALLRPHVSGEQP
jgi:hypothetical protein